MKTHTFPNGFRVIYEKSNIHLPNTSIRGFVKLGSIYEPSHLKGASHLIEHMCFKGTKNQPLSNTIIRYYDSIGAEFNAYTEKEYTCYEIKCQNNELKNSIYHLSSMMLNSSFKKEEYLKEHKVIIEENIKKKDDAQNTIIEKINSLLYENTSYSDPIDTLVYQKNGLKYEDVFQFYLSFYQPHNMVLSIISQTSFSVIKSFIETSFFIKQEKIYRQPLYSPKIEYSASSNIQCKTYIERDLNATYLSISFRVCSYHNNDQYPLFLLSEILCGTFSSLLYNLLREENGLTYSCRSEVNFYNYFGDLSIYVILNPTKLLKNGNEKGVLPLIIQLLNDLYEKGVEKKVLNIIKSYIKGQFLIESEDSNNPCEHNGKNMLLDCEEIPFSKLYSKHFSFLQKENIDTIIQKYLKKSNMCCCLLGTHIPSLSIFEKECNKFVG